MSTISSDVQHAVQGGNLSVGTIPWPLYPGRLRREHRTRLLPRHVLVSRLLEARRDRAGPGRGGFPKIIFEFD